MATASRFGKSDAIAVVPDSDFGASPKLSPIDALAAVSEFGRFPAKFDDRKDWPGEGRM